MAMKIVYDLKIIVDHTLKAPFSAKKYLIVEYLIVEIYCITLFSIYTEMNLVINLVIYKSLLKN